MRKWKCVKSSCKWWTVDEIYKTDDEGYGAIDDLGVGRNLPIFALDKSIFEEIKGFTKSDLKPCMLVKLRNGNMGSVVQTQQGLSICNCSCDSSWNPLKDYNDNLVHIGTCGHDWDIMEVYGYALGGSKGSMFTYKFRDCLWKREEKSEKDLKIEELQAKAKEIQDELEKLKEDK